MGDPADFRPSDQRRERAWIDDANWVDKSEPKLSDEELQQIAHDRNRICKQRDCATCAPLREQRRLKKAERKAEAKALHAQGTPCTRSTCENDICVAARTTTPAPAAQPAPTNAPADGATKVGERQAKRHRVGLPCGTEECGIQECVDGFAKERTRRHRAGRPCRSVVCDNPVCVAG